MTVAAAMSADAVVTSGFLELLRRRADVGWVVKLPLLVVMT